MGATKFMGKIRYLVMDVDGTLTNGNIYMGQQGELAKAFNIKDGAGIAIVLPKLGIVPVIITARESKILSNRCKEIGIELLHQNVKDKLEKLKEIVGSDLSIVAYAGDDIPDIPCVEEVRKAGGMVVCPADAIPEIKAMANYISGYKAGYGAIRDCINFLINYEDNDQDNENRIKHVIDCIISGQYCDGYIYGNPYTIQEYSTKKEVDCVLESHRNHIDIQYIIEGHELIKTYMTSALTSAGMYDLDNDTEFWKNGMVSIESIMVPGSFIVIKNGQPHKGAISYGGVVRVKKLVCKIAI